MATITYHNVGIKAMAACVPSRIMYNKDLGYLIPQEDIDKLINNIGIEERRYADPDVCASDLCFKAARQLLEDNQIESDSIDALFFISQTPDYRIPATAPILQNRLGLLKSTACLDLSLGCSGYVYALSTAFAYASMNGINRVLLLNGETFSKIVNPFDKVNAPLYGDAGTATLIEKGCYKDSVFVLNSDGAGEGAVKIPSGAFRNKLTQESFLESEREDGNIRNDLQVFMDGMDVFNFAMNVVPNSVKEILKITGTRLDDIDYLVFHQANKFMTDFFVKRLKFDLEKVPYSIKKYGNTSSASVPLTIVSELEEKLKDEKTVLMSAYGAGLSWATAKIVFNNCSISPVIDY
jgi:3-oxoacyl-[acyl-carrier-protein] synthase III